MILKFINKRGNAFELTQNAFFHLLNVDGMTTANSDIKTTTIGGIDGTVINNIQAQPRTIIFDLEVKQDKDVEEAKRALLNVIKLKQNCKLEWTQNNRTLVIDGVVEGVEMPRFNNAVNVQVTIYCPDGFWYDANYTARQVDEALPLHYFTTSSADMLYFPEEGIAFGEIDMSRTREINNTGDADAGLIIEIKAYKTLTDPIIYANDGKFFGLGYEGKHFTMQPNDVVIISTEKGNKRATKNGVNLFEYIKPFSTWLQLEAGVNTFSIDANEEEINNMTFTLQYKQKYI